MEQKLLKIKDGDSCYSFRYYRYKVAEYLHKFVNFITWTRSTKFGHAYHFTKEDIDYLREEAKAEGVTWEKKEDEFITNWHKQQIFNLLRQFQMDGYFSKWIKVTEDGGMDIGITFYMLALNSAQIFNEENAMTIGDNSETKSNSRRIAI